MHLSGKLRVTAPKGRTIGALHQPANLAVFLPGHAVVTETGVGGYDFVVSKALGPMALKLVGTLIIQPIQRGLTYSFKAEAQHMLAGNVVLDLQMNFATDGDDTVVDYSGTLSATGMVGGILERQHQRVQDRLNTGMYMFKTRLERATTRISDVAQAHSRT